MAKKMAEVDRIPLLATTMDLDELIEALKHYSQYQVME
jgi:putative transcriptional regulator